MPAADTGRHTASRESFRAKMLSAPSEIEATSTCSLSKVKQSKLGHTLHIVRKSICESIIVIPAWRAVCLLFSYMQQQHPGSLVRTRNPQWDTTTTMETTTIWHKNLTMF